jgi:hypothetical protein
MSAFGPLADIVSHGTCVSQDKTDMTFEPLTFQVGNDGQSSDRHLRVELRVVAGSIFPENGSIKGPS